MPHATQVDERTLLIAIQDSFQVKQPDLYRDLFDSSKDDATSGLKLRGKGLAAILAYPRQNLLVTVPPLEILDELHRLLAHVDLANSYPQRKLLAFLVVVCLLQRPQLCLTKQIREFCSFHGNTNLSVYMAHLRARLKQCYESSHVSAWIMFKRGADNDTPYVPEFGDKNIPVPLDIPAPRVIRRQFNGAAYNVHLARVFSAGTRIEILTRAAELITGNSALLQVIRKPSSAACLTVSLLNWDLAHGDEKKLIQKNWEILQDWNFTGAKLSLNLLTHAAWGLDVEIALIGDNELLVAPLDVTPVSFVEVRKGDAFFARWNSLVRTTCDLAQRLKDAQTETSKDNRI